MSIGKIALTNNLAAVTRIVGQALGPRLVADAGEEGAYCVGGVRVGGAWVAIRRRD